MAETEENKASVYIIQRQTIDWSAITREQFREESARFCRLWGRADDHVYRMASLWDETFRHSYFECRAAMKELADCNLATLEACNIIPYRDYCNIPADGWAYLFIDDDDWYAPDIASRLRASNLGNHDVAIWKGVTLGGPRSPYPLFFWGANGRCMTNNYAVNGQWAMLQGNFDKVRQHGDAVRTLEETDNLLINEWLGITNKHPCSSVSLEQGLDGQLTPDRLAGVLHQYCSGLDTLGAEDFDRAPWGYHLMVRVREFFHSVLDGAKH